MSWLILFIPLLISSCSASQVPTPHYAATYYADKARKDITLATQSRNFEETLAAEIALYQFTETPEWGECPYVEENIDCYCWSGAAADLMQSSEVSDSCFFGIVTGIYNSQKAAFINFDNAPYSFRGVSFDFSFNDTLVGQCIRISGLLNKYEDRPQIIIRDKGQITPCNMP